MSTTAPVIVTDGELATLASRQVELFIRFKKGIYANPSEVLNGIQRLIEGKSIEIVPTIALDVVDKVPSGARSLNDMVLAGHYDRVNSDINEKNFGPETLIVGNEPKLFHFDRISSEDAIVEMDKAGFKPGTLGDLLVYGAKNPEEQRKYPIIALGSVVVVDGSRLVAFLDWGSSDRELGIDWFGNVWNGRCRFLAVRK